MNEPIQQILVAFIPSVITAIVTALLTVRLSVRQFHSQRWWENKAETYSAILERLSELQFTIREFWSGFTVLGPGSDEGERLRDMFRNAKEAIAKAASIGSFIVSDETAQVLESLRKFLEIMEGANSADDYERLHTALTGAMSKIRAQAKKDLRVE